MTKDLYTLFLLSTQELLDHITLDTGAYLNCCFAEFGLDMKEIYPVYQVTSDVRQIGSRPFKNNNNNKNNARVNLELMS